MLKFFQRIRRKLLDEGNLKRYFIYSIGEILLVVIGILIALQINNWNQQNRDSRTEEKALFDLQEEFVSNKKIFDEYINKKKSVYREGVQFLAIIRNPEIAISEKPLRRPSVGRRTYNPSMGIIYTILNSDKIDKLENDSLRYWLSNWNDIMIDFQEEMQEQQNFISTILKPYEASIFPLTIEGKGRTINDQKSIDSYQKANGDMKYQNLLILNYQLLNVHLEESKLVEDAFIQIQRLLKRELERK